VKVVVFGVTGFGGVGGGPLASDGKIAAFTGISCFLPCF